MADGNKLNAPTQSDGKAQSNIPVQSQTIVQAKPDDKPGKDGVDAPKAAQPQPPPQQEAAGEDLTYLPGPGDPAKTTWRGIEFKANVPTRVTDAMHIEAARTNKFFRVGKGDPKDAGRNPNDGPKTPTEYRAHVVAWIKTCESVEDLVKHWADDRVLRQTCDVGADDVKWLGTMAEPVLHDLRMKQGMSDTDVARVWVKYGILDLPWRG